MTRRLLSTQASKQTYKLQGSLPSLPVPSIESTITKYLKSIKPFVKSQEEYKQQEQLINDFFKTQGSTLQTRLEKLASSERNWLSKYWDDYAYLTYNDPVMPYVSYFYGHKDLNNKIGCNQLLKATAIIDQAVDFQHLVNSETLQPELMRDTPLCMESFKYLFNGSRIPHTKGTDSNVVYPMQGFIIVIKNGEYFKLFTHDQSSGERLHRSDIYNQLVFIDQYAKKTKKDSIGVLTSLPRDEWFDKYNELIKFPVNKYNLDAIHKAGFILVLEEDLPVTLKERAQFCWYGSGTNRFWDKPVQFFIAKNGYSGFIGEHSKMDGTTTLALNEYINKNIRKLNDDEFIAGLNGGDNYEVENLKWLINADIKSSIKKAEAKLKQEVGDQEISVWKYQRFGKQVIKSLKYSPDAFVQMIIQLAIFKMEGTVLPTYEAASTRRFFKGRTEATRSVSEESLKFVENFNKFDVSNPKKVEYFNNAINSHLNYVKNASNGHGIDRHLLGLEFQLEKNEQPHEFLKNSLKLYSQTWLVSTSQISSEYHDAWGWSEVNPIGWGLAYQILNDSLQINICAKKSSGNNTELLRHYLNVATDEVYELLISTNKSKL